MSLITLVVTIAVTGLFVWAVTTAIPMGPQFKRVIYVLCVVFLALYVLQAFGLFHGLHDIKIGK